MFSSNIYLYISVILSFVVPDSTTAPGWCTFSIDTIFHMQSACYCTFTGKCRALCLCVCMLVCALVYDFTESCLLSLQAQNKPDQALSCTLLSLCILSSFQSLLVLRMAFFWEDPLPILSSSFNSLWRMAKKKAGKYLLKHSSANVPPSCLAVSPLPCSWGNLKDRWHNV